jgi:hypothetical protein
MPYSVVDHTGRTLDAHFDVEGTRILVHSRDRAGGKHARNRQYATGLRILLERIVESNLAIAYAWVEDGERPNARPPGGRRLAFSSTSDPEESSRDVYRLIASRSKSIFKAGGGARRLTIDVAGAASSKGVLKVLKGNSPNRLRAAGDRGPLDDDGSRLVLIEAEDPEWSEGTPKLRAHMKKERASGLAAAKRVQFKRIHGKLFCELCGFDPVKAYSGLSGEASIEVHHVATQVQHMDGGHLTRLKDLQCLCANCHRVVHRRLRGQIRSAQTTGAHSSQS